LKKGCLDLVKTLLMMENPEITGMLPDKQGSYCLVFHLKDPTKVAVGKFGTYFFQQGFYYYFGSAKGSGGLRARINRHVSMEKKKFWHIDYLRSYLIFIAVVFTMDINK
jgi:Uri superfamily endonuclease